MDDGLAAALAGRVMARVNRDMERAAVDELGPRPDGRVLAVGFGPGVGLCELLRRVPDGRVAGIDPSATMVAQARRRVASVGVCGLGVELVQASAASIPWPDGAFDGVVAVNSMQLWDPLPTSLAEVARVLRPGGVLVTVTHVWAIRKRGSVDDWIATMTAGLAACALDDVAHRSAPYRSGDGLVLRATKSQLRNVSAP